MTNNWSGYLVLAVGALAGGWLWQAPEDPVQVLVALALALAAVGGAFWYSRAQHARRWRTALDAYAERSLTSEKSAQQEGGKTGRGPFGVGSALRAGRPLHQSRRMA